MDKSHSVEYRQSTGSLQQSTDQATGSAKFAYLVLLPQLLRLAKDFKKTFPERYETISGLDLDCSKLVQVLPQSYRSFLSNTY